MLSGVFKISLNYALNGSEFHRGSPGTLAPTVNICALSVLGLVFLVPREAGAQVGSFPMRSCPLAGTCVTGQDLCETPSCSPEIKRGFVCDSSKGLRSRSQENPRCLAVVTKTGSAKIITRSWTMSCTLSAETYVSYLFILEVVTGRKVKIPACDWHHPWKQRINFLLLESRRLWKFLEQHMRHVTYHHLPEVVYSVTSD